MTERKMPTYEERENTPPSDVTKANMSIITQWIYANSRIPTVEEVMKITSFKYDWASAVRRKVLREFPRVDLEELVDEIKVLLLKRLRDEEIDNASLVRLMPWVAAPMAPAVDVKQEVTHRFVVEKPEEVNPAEEKGEDNRAADPQV